MKVYIKHIVIILLSTLAVLSCKKNEPVLTEEPILMSFKEAGQTKALLNGETFAANGNQIQVYDYYTDANKTAESIYINDIATSSGNGTWPFTESHKWTTDGVHKFFGWMTNDESGKLAATDLFTSGLLFDTNTKVLTIPTTALTQTSPQFDFMYSDIHVRDLNTNPYFTAVPLEFSHLFTAFRVTAADNSTNTVYLKKVSITGLKNKRGATITYSEDEPIVTYSYPSDAKSSNFIYERSEAGGKELVSEPLDISDGYILMWPHSKEDFAEAKIVVQYDYKGPGGTLNRDGVTTIEMRDLQEWQAGKKNTVGLMFRDKEVALTCIVEPWTVENETIDFTNQISASKPIKWVSKTVEHIDEKKGEVILYSDSLIVATCNFHIDTPAGGTWTASLIPIEGYSDAFKIEDGTKYGAVGVDSEIKIRVTNQAPIAPRHVVKLRITVQTADGRTIVADLMPDETTDENITEYKIIQNLING